MADFFTTLSASFTTERPQIPTNDETPKTGQGSGGYCVAFAKDASASVDLILVDEETPKTGQGSGGYCTIA